MYLAYTGTKLGIFNYIHVWYNSHRSHSKLGYLSSNEFENMNLGFVSSPVSAKYKKYTTTLQNLARQVATIS